MSVEIPRDRQRTAPVVGHAQVTERREQCCQTVDEMPTDLIVGIELTRDLGPEVISRTSTAKRKPTIGGALPVNDVLTEIRKGGAPIYTDLGPHLIT